MKLYLLALLLLLSPLSQADSKLTKADLEAYVSAMQEFSQLADKYPDEVAIIEAKNENFSYTDGGKAWAKTMRGAPFLKEINSILSANGYGSVEQFTAQASRIITAMVAVQMDKMDVEMKVRAKEMDGYLAQMRQQGLSEEMIAQVQTSMTQASNAMAEAEKAQKMATTEDKALVKANLVWLEAQVSSFSEDENSQYPDDAE